MSELSLHRVSVPAGVVDATLLNIDNARVGPKSHWRRSDSLMRVADMGKLNKTMRKAEFSMEVGAESDSFRLRHVLRGVGKGACGSRWRRTPIQYQHLGPTSCVAPMHQTARGKDSDKSFYGNAEAEQSQGDGTETGGEQLPG